MAGLDELEIRIDRTGKVEIHVAEGHGIGCIALTRDMEKAIGELQERVFLPGYYENVTEIEGQEKAGLSRR